MTAALARTRGRKLTRKSRTLQSRASGYIARRSNLPEYLEMADVETLIRLAPKPMLGSSFCSSGGPGCGFQKPWAWR